LTFAAIAAAVALAACNSEGPVAVNGRHMQPLSDRMVADLETRNMAKESPILVRIFKEESELEVWKVDKTGRFALLRTYPICRWSGDLGPKFQQGDRQAPEGFYPITPGLMNPNSNYYLAINTGFPNAYDQANGRTGQFLMIHGDCASVGCYAMTDEQIAEIYALARESFFGGQRSFQIQAYPFRMTPLNMAKHRDSPHMAFWRMLKQGYDHFEVSRLEPKIDVCDKHYVFDAQANGRFSPAAACPAYKVNEELVAAVKEKQQRDDQQMAELVNRGTATVPVRTGTDGGMHPTFLAAFKRPYTDSAGVIRSPFVSLPGTIPSHARPPGEPNSDAATGSVFVTASAESKPVSAPSGAQSGGSSGGGQSGSSSGLFSNLFSSSSAPASASKEQPAASSKEQPKSGGGMFDGMKRLVGLGGSEPAATTEAPKSKAAPKTTQVAAKPKTEPKTEASPKVAAPAPGAIRPEQKQQANADAEPKPANSASLLNGAQPTVPTGSFDSRWGQFR
jgi:murein L,D-transpeptidase YafK